VSDNFRPVSFDPRNILVIDFGQLGDVVLSLPALRAIRERFPQAKVTVAVGKPGGEIIRLSKYANEVLEIDRVALRDGPKLTAGLKIIKLISELRKAKFDLVIDLHSLSETNLLGFLSGAPKRLYSRRPNRSLDFLSNFRPVPPPEATSNHIVDRYLDVLKPLNIQNSSRLPHISPDSKGNETVEKLLKKEKAESGSLLVGIFPGAGHESRKWPLERFVELSDHLIRNDRVRIVVFAGPEESKMIPQMRSMFPATTIFLEKLSISQLAAAQARLTLLVSNDTGPMHLAAAVGTSVIVIMDRPTPHSFIPVGNQHRMIYGSKITAITMDEVYKAAHEMLGRSRTDKLFNKNSQ
jgi:ADP-heptose:LPS heptosyltransferase